MPFLERAKQEHPDDEILASIDPLTKATGINVVEEDLDTVRAIIGQIVVVTQPQRSNPVPVTSLPQAEPGLELAP
jgi:hypothetical protein